MCCCSSVGGGDGNGDVTTLFRAQTGMLFTPVRLRCVGDWRDLWLISIPTPGGLAHREDVVVVVVVVDDPFTCQSTIAAAAATVLLSVSVQCQSLSLARSFARCSVIRA